MMGPIEFTVGWQRSIGRSLAAHPGTKDETDDQTNEAEDEHEDSQVPREYIKKKRYTFIQVSRSPLITVIALETYHKKSTISSPGI